MIINFQPRSILRRGRSQNDGWACSGKIRYRVHRASAAEIILMAFGDHSALQFQAIISGQAVPWIEPRRSGELSSAPSMVYSNIYYKKGVDAIECIRDYRRPDDYRILFRHGAFLIIHWISSSRSSDVGW